MRDFNESYTIRDFIDKNKWSNVYMGINNETNQNVIINILINIDGNENKIEKFTEEINLLKNIDSSNLISINNMYKQNDKDKRTYFLESEDFEGWTLKTLKEVSEITKVQSLQIIREVLNGVLELNSIGLNFESLSEDDIVVNSKGVVKVNTLNFINKHQGHINCEDVLESKFRKNADVFVIGNILSELLTNKKNFNNKNHNIDFDEDLKEILEKCTNKKYKSRHKYDNLEYFLSDIISYLENGVMSSKKAINSEEVERFRFEIEPKTKKYLLICIALVLVSSASVFGIKYYLDNKKPKNQVTETKTIVNDDNKQTTEQKTPTIDKYNNSTVTPTASNKNKESTNKEKNNTNSHNNDKNHTTDINNSNGDNTINNNNNENNEEKNNQTVNSEENSENNTDKDPQEPKEDQNTNSENDQENSTENSKDNPVQEDSTNNNKDNPVQEDSINIKENSNVNDSKINDIQQ